MNINEIKNNDGLVSLVLSMPMLNSPHISFARTMCHSKPHGKSRRKKINGIEIKRRMHLYIIHYGFGMREEVCAIHFRLMCKCVCVCLCARQFMWIGKGCVANGIGGFCAKQINFIFVRYPNTQNMAFAILLSLLALYRSHDCV